MRVFPNGSGLLLGLFITFGLAWFVPFSHDGGLTSLSDLFSKGVVILIFCIQGWSLQVGRLKIIFLDVRNLLKVQGLIFAGPLILVLLAGKYNFLPEEWLAGFLFLSILPTTISSCVVYTSLAGGDSDVALAYATLSNLLAILWVPFAWLLFGTGLEGDLLDRVMATGKEILPKIFMHILIPCLLGWFFKLIFFKDKAKFIGERLKKVTFGGILILVYLALSKAVLDIGQDELITLLLDLFPFLLSFLLCHLLLSWFGTGFGCRNPQFKIAEFFCISQKSLAMGMPLLVLLSSNDLDKSVLISCPLILYHFLQLGVGACFLSPLKQWTKQKS
jgi:sodium/bile acid cotransporter 7